MQEIKRDLYLNKLIRRKENKMVKIITGLRRCGKSYLLNTIFFNYLKSQGVEDSHIIKMDFDSPANEQYHEALPLFNHLKNFIKDDKIYYFLLDEIQLVNKFESVLNGLLRIENVDVYVTGSNSKFLSSDIITEFRGRGDEIRLYPLTFAEFSSAYDGTKEDAWEDYINYGGLPLIMYKTTVEDKTLYLNELFQKTYLTDILNRNKIQRNDILDSLINVLSSSTGSLTSINRITNTFKSLGVKEVSFNTVCSYVNYLIDSFLINKVDRYDVKGLRYISAQSKYYFTDIGLRNARLNFRDTDPTHLMENIIYNELLVRGYNVDVGIVEQNVVKENGTHERKQLEVDFICNQGSKRYYVQSAFSIPDENKMKQETKSLKEIKDSFKKIVIVKDSLKNFSMNNDGIIIMTLQKFLLDPHSLEL